MASEENVKEESCIHDPDFAVICSFFEKFSALCGIQQPSFTELQQMLEDTDEISPQLIDLHVRLMRKAKKNVNPDRWQKALARFCWFNQPEDCWMLENKGYEHLSCSQKLKLLLTLIGAQFDHNVKLKTDINKLDVKELRLEPLGKDKDGHNYWVHMDRETTLKVYKEDPDEEKWELIAQDREGLVKLIDELMKDKDPNRKLEEIEDDDESEASAAEEEEPDPDLDAKEELEDEQIEDEEDENGSDSDTGSNYEIERERTKKERAPVNVLSQDQSNRSVPVTPAIKKQSGASHAKTPLVLKPQESATIPPKKSPLELISRPRSSNAPTPVKALDKESFAQHLQKLDSQNMLRPLLNLTESGEEISSADLKPDSLKSKINQKFNIIKPVLQTDILKSKLESAGKGAKPGLKLEQILKSKLAQKLSGNFSTETTNVNEVENDKKSEKTESAINKSELSTIQLLPGSEEIKTDTIKQNLENSEKLLVKKTKEEAVEDSEKEIEEPVMIVTGVGNGHDCNCNNYEDNDEIEEPLMFIYGVGSGSECATGNNENNESSNKNQTHTSHLTHKVDNILKSTPEGEQNASNMPSTSSEDKITSVPTDLEKKKPKLWTIDAICSSDSSKDTKRDNVSQFPNFSFNKDSKIESPMPYRSTTESYSIFSLTENKDVRDAANVIPTNFYFGSNNQNPCFLSPEISPNTFKSKSHNVEDIVEDLDKKSESKTSDAKVTKFDVESLYSNSEEPQPVNRSQSSISIDVKETEIVEKKDESVTVTPEPQVNIAENDLNCVATSVEQITTVNAGPVPEITHKDEVESKNENVENVREDDISPPIEDISVELIKPKNNSNEPVPEKPSSPGSNCKNLDTASEHSNFEKQAIENELTELKSAISEEKITNIENQNLEDTNVPSPNIVEKKNEDILDKSVQSSEKPSVENENRTLNETPTEPIEAVENVIVKSHKTDNNEETSKQNIKNLSPIKFDDVEVESAKIKDVEKTEPVIPSVDVEQPSKSTESQHASYHSTEKIDEKLPNDSEPAVTEEKSVIPADPLKKESLPEGEQKTSEEIIKKEIEPDQKDRRRSKQKKSTDISENIQIEENETQKKTDDEMEETTGTRRTTRRSRVIKTDTKSDNEKIENANLKKTPRKGKQKNDNDDSKATSKAGRKSRITTVETSSDNEKETTTSQPDMPKKPEENEKEEEEGKIIDIANEKLEKEKTENVEGEKDEESENEIKPKEEPKKPGRRGKRKRRGGYTKKTSKAKTPKNDIPEKNNESTSEATEKHEDEVKAEDSSVKKEPNEPKKKRTKRGWLNEVDINNIEVPANTESPGIRQSRRIAQLKIKEQAEIKYQETVTAAKKSTTNQKSKMVTPSKKNKAAKGKLSKYKPPKDESEEESFYDTPSSKRKRKKKKDKPKKKFDPKKAWKQSSESSSEEEEEEDHFEEEDEELVVNDASDHEFSPESDIDEDDEYQPVKRARTAHSKPRAEDKTERDDLACQSCGTAEQPEWILLCDVCDEGWHAACLKPPVMAIPEGDWFCPPCQHNKLISGLQKFLKTYDKAVKKRASEESRRKRLEYVNISFSNILKEQLTANKDVNIHSQPSSETEESSEDESEEEEEPLYQLRIRRQRNVRHRLNEYEELMNSAIENEDGDLQVGTVENQSNVNGALEVDSNDPQVTDPSERVQKESNDDENEDEEENVDQETEKENEKETPVLLQLRNVRKKPARLTNLDVSSEDDHYSDEDFKGSSGDDPEEDDEYGKSETDSDEASYRRGRGGREPVRRSTRARRTRYDNDFINDNSEEDEENARENDRKKKRKRSGYSESDSEEEDSTWGRRKRNKNSQSHRPPSNKKRRRIRFDGDSDEDKKKKKNSRIKYGLDDDDEEDDYLPSRRTRGKKINYRDNLDSESEEEENSKSKNKGRKIVSDDEYVNDEDEQNAGKESVASENGEHSESESESDESMGESEQSETSKVLPVEVDDSVSEKNKNFKVLVPESDDSVSEKNKNSKGLVPELDDANSSPVKLLKIGPIKTYEKVNQESSVKSDQMVKEDTVKIEPTDDIDEKKISPIKEILKDDNGLSVQKTDQNPSLQGMQSMAQNLSQPMPGQFSQKVLPDATIPGRIPVQQSPVQVGYEVNAKYERAETITPSPDGKFQHPIDVSSPDKVYTSPDMSPGNRPHLPPFIAPQLQPPQVRPPGISNLPGIPNRPIPPMPSALPLPRGPIPMQGPMPPRIPHLTPPPNVNIAQCAPPGSMLPNIIPSTTDASPKRRPRGRGKKQLEMERLQREREAMDANRNEDMVPVHPLKVPVSDVSVIRPPMSFPNSAGPPPPPFSTYQQMPFPQAPPLTQQQAAGMPLSAGNSSKRIKITPTRMRMAAPPLDKIIHFPRSPGSAAIYPVRHPPVTSSSGSGQTTLPDGKSPPVSGASTVPSVPGKSEAGTVRTESPEQYYHLAPYPPNQSPRGYAPRADYTFVRKPAPGMYQPSPPVSLATSTAPNVVVSRTGGFANTGPPPVSSPNAKSESSTITTSAPPSVPQPYPAQYAIPPHITPTASPPIAQKPGQSSPYLPPVATTQSSGPPGLPGHPVSNPPSAYPVHLIRPPPSSAGTPPYPAPYYARAPFAPPSTQPPASFTHTVPSPNFPSSAANRLQSQTPGPYKPPSSAAPTTEANTLNSLPPSSQSNDYQYSETPLGSSSEPETFNQSSSTRYEEENTSAEETPISEFGGLVSYFSSQREDDLDS